MARVQSVFNKLKVKLKSAQECWKCKIVLQIRKWGQCNRDMPRIRAVSLFSVVRRAERERRKWPRA